MNLKELRENKNMSQVDVARSIGVHLNTYSLWERGGGNPSDENMEKLKKLFNIKETE